VTLRGELQDDPLVFALRDSTSRRLLFVMAAAYALAVFGLP